MNPRNWTNELWAFLVLGVGVSTYFMGLHFKADIGIATTIVGAALMKFTSKPDPHSAQAVATAGTDPSQVTLTQTTK